MVVYHERERKEKEKKRKREKEGEKERGEIKERERERDKREEGKNWLKGSWVLTTSRDGGHMANIGVAHPLKAAGEVAST